VTGGLQLVLWGFFKKMVIADNAALIVNYVFANVFFVPGSALIIAVVLFAFQIYCDFSGYSDIARGVAQMLGFKLMLNFNLPYLSQSIAEFWRRWHISLSSWFRDYVYIPLGGNRVLESRHYFNLLVTFGLSGLWHGANWTFVIWGVINGIYLIFSLWTKKIREQLVYFLRINNFPLLYQIFKTGLTFLLICLSWVFFRARDIVEAMYILTHFFTDITKLLSYQYLRYHLFVVDVLGVDKLFFFQVTSINFNSYDL
jgi:D-alanyl-lipoteichoic acid acyltransferase DltB (MBOAT superfamily)